MLPLGIVHTYLLYRNTFFDFECILRTVQRFELHRLSHANIKEGQT